MAKVTPLLMTRTSRTPSSRTTAPTVQSQLAARATVTVMELSVCPVVCQAGLRRAETALFAAHCTEGCSADQVAHGNESCAAGEDPEDDDHEGDDTGLCDCHCHGDHGTLGHRGVNGG